MAMLLLFSLASASWGAGSAVFTGVAGNGMSNGAILEGTGTNEITVNLYYLAGTTARGPMPASLSTRIGFQVKGEGFDDELKGKQLGFTLDRTTDPEWLPVLGGVNYSLGNADVLDDGTFSTTLIASHSSVGYNPSGETLVLFLRNASAGGQDPISEERLIVHVKPIAITLPVQLDPVTLYTATDYSKIINPQENPLADPSTAGASASITTADGIKLAVSGLTLTDPDGEKVKLTPGTTVPVTDEVSISATADGSTLIFKTPPGGATDEIDPQSFTISGSGLSVASDGNAKIAGLTGTPDIGKFTIEVESGGSFVFNKSDLTFKAGDPANETVTITLDPAKLGITDIKVFDSADNEVTGLDGLVMTPGSDNKSIVFSGTPTGPIEGKDLWVEVTTSAGNTIRADDPLVVKVAEADKPVYNAVIPSGIYGGEYSTHSENSFWAVDQKVETSFSVTDASGNPLVDAGGNAVDLDIYITDADGNRLTDWKGLEFSVDGNKVNINGTPTDGTSGGTETLYVNVSSASGTAEITPGRIPLRVAIDDVSEYVLSVNPGTLNVPVGKNFETNIDLSTTPDYKRDMIPREISIEDADTAAQSEQTNSITWNKLTIEAFQDMSSYRRFLTISGKAEEAARKTFRICFKRGNNINIEEATLTIETYDEAETPPKVELVISDPVTVETLNDDDDDGSGGDDDGSGGGNDDDEKLVDVGAGEPVEAEIGKTTQIIYNLSVETSLDQSINIETINVQYGNGSETALSHLTYQDIADLLEEKLNAWYYDKAGNRIILYVTPVTQEVQKYKVFYYDGAVLNERPITVYAVKETTTSSSYYRSDDGCNAGASGLLALSIFAAGAALIRKPFGRRQK
jgi:hypothetical protein